MAMIALTNSNFSFYVSESSKGTSNLITSSARLALARCEDRKEMIRTLVFNEISLSILEKYKQQILLVINSLESINSIVISQHPSEIESAAFILELFKERAENIISFTLHRNNFKDYAKTSSNFFFSRLGQLSNITSLNILPHYITKSNMPTHFGSALCKYLAQGSTRNLNSFETCAGFGAFDVLRHIPKKVQMPNILKSIVLHVDADTELRETLRFLSSLVGMETTTQIENFRILNCGPNQNALSGFSYLFVQVLKNRKLSTFSINARVGKRSFSDLNYLLENYRKESSYINEMKINVETLNLHAFRYSVKDNVHEKSPWNSFSEFTDRITSKMEIIKRLDESTRTFLDRVKYMGTVTLRKEKLKL
eukprot:maker-scaffold_41-snap-gene-0.33-mRNA-1 protein AED:0.02 eAED:0.02 QI:57/0/0.5/1/0/0.5/2/0/366